MTRRERQTAHTQFLAYCAQGYSWATAAQATGIALSRTTAYRLRKHAAAAGGAAPSDRRQGHPYKVSPAIRTVGGPTIVIIAEHKRANPAVNLRGVSLFTSTVRRGSPDYLDPRLNCHSKLHEVLALQQALHAGADEALMLDIHGFVSTCNATNFFIVRAGEVWTSTGQYCLHGITRGRILALGPSEGIPVYEKNFSLTAVYDADEAFVTGTFAGLIPVHTIDGRAIGGPARPLLARLQSLYRADIAHYVATHPRLPEGAGEIP